MFKDDFVVCFFEGFLFDDFLFMLEFVYYGGMVECIVMSVDVVVFFIEIGICVEVVGDCVDSVVYFLECFELSD